MYTEDDLLPLSALQHLLYCDRQCALIHLEGVWLESRHTVEGRHLHERADLPGAQSREGVRVARALMLRSLRLGLSGKADVVEFHRAEATAETAPGAGAPAVASPQAPSSDARSESPSPAGALPAAIALPHARGLWRPFPVEYKRGEGTVRSSMKDRRPVAG